jgi:hypothetical protein
MPAAEREDLLHEAIRNSVGVCMWRARMISESLDPIGFVTLDPLGSRSCG